jgi:hypothetical protein
LAFLPGPWEQQWSFAVPLSLAQWTSSTGSFLRGIAEGAARWISGTVIQQELMEGEFGTHLKVQLRERWGRKYVCVICADSSKRFYQGSDGFIINYHMFDENIERLQVALRESEVAQIDHEEIRERPSSTKIGYYSYIISYLGAGEKCGELFQIYQDSDAGFPAVILSKARLMRLLDIFARYREGQTVR